MLSLIPTRTNIRLIQSEYNSSVTMIIMDAEPSPYSSVEFDNEFKLKWLHSSESFVSGNKVVIPRLILIKRSKQSAKELESRGVQQDYAGAAFYDGGGRLDLTLCLNDEEFDFFSRMAEKGIMPMSIEIELLLNGLPFKSTNNRWHQTPREDGLGSLSKKISSFYFEYPDITTAKLSWDKDGHLISYKRDAYLKAEAIRVANADAERQSLQIIENSFGRITMSLSVIGCILVLVVVLLIYLAYKAT